MATKITNVTCTTSIQGTEVVSVFSCAMDPQPDELWVKLWAPIEDDEMPGDAQLVGGFCPFRIELTVAPAMLETALGFIMAQVRKTDRRREDLQRQLKSQTESANDVSRAATKLLAGMKT